MTTGGGLQAWQGYRRGTALSHSTSSGPRLGLSEGTESSQCVSTAAVSCSDRSRCHHASCQYEMELIKSPSWDSSTLIAIYYCTRQRKHNFEWYVLREHAHTIIVVSIHLYILIRHYVVVCNIMGKVSYCVSMLMCKGIKTFFKGTICDCSTIWHPLLKYWHPSTGFVHMVIHWNDGISMTNSILSKLLIQPDSMWQINMSFTWLGTLKCVFTSVCL